MNDNDFNRLLDGIYGIFGRVRPTSTQPAYTTLRRRLEEKFFPADAIPFVVSQFETYDNLPSNLGKAIMAEFAEWRAKNPSKQAQYHKCSECASDLEGFYWARREDGSMVVVKCPCNDAPQYAHVEAISAGELHRRGWTRSNGRQAENAEYWAEQARNWKAGQEYAKPSGMVNNMQGIIGHQGREREEHAKLRDEYEYGMS